MTRKSGTLRGVLLGAATAVACLLGACSSTSNTASGTGGLTGVSPTGTATNATPTGGTATSGSTPAVTPGPTAPTYYFGNAKTYDVWIIKVSGSTLTIAVVHHLTGTDAETYLTSHGQTLGPDGIPDDYINVDTRVHKTVQLADSATVTTNEEGAGPAPLSASGFLTWLQANPATPIASGDQDTYPGAPTFSGPLFEVKFTNDVMVSANQIFEP
jgi:hypothetical protein